MSGVMEILLVVLIAVGIFMLPRVMNRQPERGIRRLDRGLKISGWMRLAVLASFLWPALLGLYIKPWNNHWHIFLYGALGPLVLAWGIFWVFSGFRKKGK